MATEKTVYNMTKREFIKIGGVALAGAVFPSFAVKPAMPSFGGR